MTRWSPARLDPLGSAPPVRAPCLLFISESTLRRCERCTAGAVRRGGALTSATLSPCCPPRCPPRLKAADLSNRPDSRGSPGETRGRCPRRHYFGAAGRNVRGSGSNPTRRSFFSFSFRRVCGRGALFFFRVLVCHLCCLQHRGFLVADPARSALVSPAPSVLTFRVFPSFCHAGRFGAVRARVCVIGAA